MEVENKYIIYENVFRDKKMKQYLTKHKKSIESLTNDRFVDIRIKKLNDHVAYYCNNDVKLYLTHVDNFHHHKLDNIDVRVYLKMSEDHEHYKRVIYNYTLKLSKRVFDKDFSPFELEKTIKKINHCDLSFIDKLYNMGSHELESINYLQINGIHFYIDFIKNFKFLMFILTEDHVLILNLDRCFLNIQVLFNIQQQYNETSVFILKYLLPMINDFKLDQKQKQYIRDVIYNNIGILIDDNQYDSDSSDDGSYKIDEYLPLESTDLFDLYTMLVHDRENLVLVNKPSTKKENKNIKNSSIRNEPKYYFNEQNDVKKNERDHIVDPFNYAYNNPLVFYFVSKNPLEYTKSYEEFVGCFEN